MTLKELTNRQGIRETAKQIGVTRAAVQYMLKNNRQIHIVQRQDGLFDFVETKFVAQGVKID
jgi:predicted transcriptional regulator